MRPALATPTPAARRAALCASLERRRGRVGRATPMIAEGRLVRMVGLTLEAIGCQAAVGVRCLVESPDSEPVEAEVVGFAGEKLYLMPTGNIRGIGPDAKVTPTGRVYEAPVGDALLGRVVDAVAETPAGFLAAHWGLVAACVGLLLIARPILFGAGLQLRLAQVELRVPQPVAAPVPIALHGRPRPRGRGARGVVRS